MNPEYFHKRIKETLDLCAYEFYTVHPIRDIKCTCVTHATQEGDPSCVMCLGTGHKIKIRKIKGASNDSIENIAGKGIKGSMSESTIRTYFVDDKFPIAEDDLIIDDNKVFYIFRINHMRAFGGIKTHKEANVLPKKNDEKIILKNFNKIMDRYRKEKHK